jgi:hypothetical protein
VAFESALEARCCAYARRRGCTPIKLGGYVVGLPDRAFLLPGGRTWLVEFKGPRGQVTPRQKHEFEALALLGHPVTLCRSFAWFKADLAEMRERPLPTPVVQLRLDLP